MPRYEYECKSCDNVQEEYHMMKDAGVESFVSKLQCQKCKTVGTMEQLITGGTGHTKFSSLSVEDKRASLKKRSSDHFKKELSDKFHQMNSPGYIP